MHDDHLLSMRTGVQGQLLRMHTISYVSCYLREQSLGRGSGGRIEGRREQQEQLVQVARTPTQLVVDVAHVHDA